MEDELIVKIRNYALGITSGIGAIALSSMITGLVDRSDTPMYDANNTRLEAKVCSVEDEGKPFFSMVKYEADFKVVDENGDTVKVVQNLLNGKRGNMEVLLKNYTNQVLADSSNTNIIFYGKYENDIKRIEYSVKPDGSIVPVKTFNADYALLKDGSMYPIMK